MDIEDKKIAYLQMIQNIIDRMSNISSNIKGFCVAVSASITALTMEGTVIFFIAVSTLYILLFVVLDIYYLGIERQYRYLYNRVRINEVNPDFDLRLNLTKCEICQAKANFMKCLSSKSIVLFYLPLFVIVIVFTFLKCMEVV